MATTYEAIATVTVGSGGAATIDFTSIPATYTDLVLKASLRSNRSATEDDFSIKFNNDTSAIYSNRRLWSDASGVNSFSNSGAANIVGQYEPAASATSNTFSSLEVYIPNYAGSNNKSLSYDNVAENNTSTAYLVLLAGLYASSNAINRITLTVGTGPEFVQYSSATLYGIKNS